MRRTRARRRANSLDQATLKILAILAKEFATGDIQRVRDWDRQDRRLLCGHPSGVGGDHRLETASGERRHVTAREILPRKLMIIELPNGLTGCDGFGTTRRERAEVRRRLRRLPSLRRVVSGLRQGLPRDAQAPWPVTIAGIAVLRLTKRCSFGGSMLARQTVSSHLRISRSS